MYAAGLVVDAGGRVSKLSRDHRSEPLGGGCGMDYTSQLFELLPGAEEGPSNSPVGHLAFHRGYQPIVFIHDNRTFSVLIIRPSKDREISLLREPGPFAAAAAAIPGLADWVDPERSVPIGPVRTGGNLTNLYKCQPSLPGLVAIGDALATTSDAMAAWSERAIRPWWADHMAIDESLHRRWRGVPLDPDAPVATDLVGEAVPVLPELLEEVGPFFAMLALPTSLDGAREKVRGLIRQGWAPGYPDGPTREELVAVMRGSRSSAPTSCR